MPAIPSSIIEPLWDQFHALVPPRTDDHPLGCHRLRIPERVVFDTLVQVLVFGCAYARIADETCSATTLRRRRDEGIAADIINAVQLIPGRGDLIVQAGIDLIERLLGNQGRKGGSDRIGDKPGIDTDRRCGRAYRCLLASKIVC